jgi:hypothetical protein
MAGTVTLNAAMRANLLSLQNTSALQAQTQGRLATGKKVNSALDGPQAYFEAQSLNFKASDLSNLLDSMGQAIQTITAATQGITAVESLVNQLQSVANSATLAMGSSGAGSASSKEAMTVSATAATAEAANYGSTDFRTMVNANNASLGIQNGDTLTVTIDGANTYTFTVGASNVNNTAQQSNGGGGVIKDLTTWIAHVDGGASATAATALAGNLTLTMNASGVVTITNSDQSHSISLGGSLVTTFGLTSSNMAAATTSASTSNAGTVGVNYGTYSVTLYADTSTLLSDLTDASGFVISNAGGSAVAGSTTTTANYALPGSTLILGTSTITITSGMTVQGLMTAIDGVSGLQATYSNAGGLQVSNTSGSAITVGGTAASLLGVTVTGGSTLASSSTTAGTTLYQGIRAGGSSGLSSLATYTAQYDTLRTQLDQLVGDTSYQGVNLINGTSNNPLTVTFSTSATNASKLTVNAVDLTTTGLGIQSASASWSGTNSIAASVSQLTNAQDTLRTQASTFGQNLTTVQTRQDFTQSLINTLQTGAGDLTNANMNTESANMLALQTQQQLGISSLSLASQAQQSILKLFP